MAYINNLENGYLHLRRNLNIGCHELLKNIVIKMEAHKPNEKE